MRNYCCLPVLFLLAFVGWGQLNAEPFPSAREILASIRLNQRDQLQVFQGQLRTDATKIPFALIISGDFAQYTFTDNNESVKIYLGEDHSKVEEVTGKGQETVSSSRIKDAIRGTDITYEDIAMRFIYWPHAQVEGEETLRTRRCYKIWAAAPPESQYGGVYVWVDRVGFALMRADCYDRNSRFVKRFEVISGQKIDGQWVLKQMRIQSHDPENRRKISSRTWLELEGKPRSNSQDNR